MSTPQQELKGIGSDEGLEDEDTLPREPSASNKAKGGWKTLRLFSGVAGTPTAAASKETDLSSEAAFDAQKTGQFPIVVPARTRVTRDAIFVAVGLLLGVSAAVGALKLLGSSDESSDAQPAKAVVVDAGTETPVTPNTAIDVTPAIPSSSAEMRGEEAPAAPTSTPTAVPTTHGTWHPPKIGKPGVPSLATAAPSSPSILPFGTAKPTTPAPSSTNILPFGKEE